VFVIRDIMVVNQMEFVIRICVSKDVTCVVAIMSIHRGESVSYVSLTTSTLATPARIWSARLNVLPDIRQMVVA